MRIISGNFRSKQINLPSYFTDRPTTDMAKEALFNILNNNYEFSNIKFLDLFSGTGSISYEMASRGCNQIICVELNRKYCDFIQRSFKDMYPDKSPARVINSDAFKFVKNNPIAYDVIFADPPFDLEGVEQLPSLIFSNQTLPKETLLIIEHTKKLNFADLTHIKDQRNYGKVNFSFFSAE